MATATVAAICVGAAALIVLASRAGWPPQLLRFEQPPAEGLARDVAIAGRASFDRDSYAIGDTLAFRIRLLYRDDLVNPDLDSFSRSISISPFERRALVQRRRVLDDGVTEFLLEYTLQAVNVEPHGMYQLNPLVLYYSGERTPGGELQALRIQPPRVHIVGYYPPDVSTTPLQELKGEIRDPTGVKQAVMGASGTLLLGLAAFLLWRSGRRRRQTELSEAERLWHRFHQLDRGSLRPQEYLVACEQIFTHLLEWRCGIGPRAFWSGADPVDPSWKDAATRARVAFTRIYQPEPPGNEDSERGGALLDELFSATVREVRLRREQEPSAFSRLRQQPGILVASVTFAVLAIAILMLGAAPALWRSDGMARYNEAVRIASNQDTRAEAAGHFAALGETSEGGVIKAASMYNAATLAATLSLTGTVDTSDQDLNDVLFQEHLSLQALFHELDEGQRIAIVDMLSRRAEALGQAEMGLKSAIRTTPRDEDIARNLEIVVKHRKAVVDTLKEYLSGQGGELGRPLEPTDKLAESLIDVLKMMELPAEHVEDAGKDDTGYHVRERF